MGAARNLSFLVIVMLISSFCCWRDQSRALGRGALRPVDTVIAIDAADRDRQLATLCKHLAGSVGGDRAWFKIEEADVQVSEVRGGLTNALFRLEPRAGSALEGVAAPVLARVFGKAGDAVCDRHRENILVQELSEAGFGPRLLGIFGNGRLESWLTDRRPVEPLEMMQVEPADTMGMIARRLAVLHETCRPYSGPSSGIWAQVREWIVLATQVSFPEDVGKAAKLEKFEALPHFQRHLEEMEELLPSSRNGNGRALIEAASAEAASPAAAAAARRARELLYEERFCHLDLLAGNILYSEQAGDVEFIDWEYATNTSIALDIANHFNAVPESCLILDSSFNVNRFYPTKEQQRRWLTTYFAARGRPLSEEQGIDEALLLDEMLKVILEFSLFVELRWVVWSIIQAAASSVGFDYLDYGLMRWEQGWKTFAAWRERGGQP